MGIHSEKQKHNQNQIIPIFSCRAIQLLSSALGPLPLLLKLRIDHLLGLGLNL